MQVTEDRSEVKSLSGASKGSQVGIGEGGSQVLRNGEGAVDDVDDAAGEVEVCLGNRDVVLEAAEEVDSLVVSNRLDDLSTSDVRVRRVGQMGVREEGSRVGDAGSRDSAIESMVVAGQSQYIVSKMAGCSNLHQCLDKTGGECGTRRVESGQSFVARSKQSNVSLVAYTAQEVELLEQSPESVELLVGQRNGTICRGSNVTASGQVAALSSILSRNESCCKGERCNLLETHLVGCKEMGVYERVRRKKSLSFTKNSSQDEGGLYVCFAS